MKRILTVVLAVMLLAGLVAACGSSGKYKDGEYSVESKADKYGNNATLKLTIKGDKIVAVDWKELANGVEKGADYGKVNGAIDNQDNYDKAQAALKLSKTFGEKLLAAQDASKIDGVSGASNSLDLFKTLVTEALNKAKK